MASAFRISFTSDSAPASFSPACSIVWTSTPAPILPNGDVSRAGSSLARRKIPRRSFSAKPTFGFSTPERSSRRRSPTGRGTFSSAVDIPTAVLSLVVPELSIDYKDYNARITYDVTTKDRLTLFTFGAADVAANIEDGKKSVLFASEFHRIDLRWDHRFDAGTTNRAAITLGLDRTRLEGKRFTRDYVLNARDEYTHRVSKNVEVRAGFQSTNDFFGTDLPDPYSLDKQTYESTARYFAPHYDFAVGGYAEATFKLPYGIELVPGARVDVFGSNGETRPAFDPRLTATIPVSKKTRFILANGIAHQPPAFAVPVPGFGIRGLQGGLQEAFQQSLGVEADLPWKITAKANAFRHAYRNFGDLFALRDADTDNLGVQSDTLNGRAIGLEFLVRRDFKERFAFIASYTLSRNTRFVRGKEIVNGFDRPHVFNLACTFNAGRGWRLGARFLTYTGAPRIEKTMADLYGVTDGNDTNAPDRLPSFYRLDVRLEKRWNLAHKRWISFIAEGLNVTANKEVLGYNCDAPGQCKEQGIGPVTVPSIGVEGGI